MKTVKELINELKKFPEDALCYGYEGEGIGIAIRTKDGKQGFIYAGETEIYRDKETELLK